MSRDFPVLYVGNGTFYKLGEDWYRGNGNITALDFDDWRASELNKHDKNAVGPFKHPATGSRTYYRVGEYWIEAKKHQLILVESGSDDDTAIQAKLAEVPYQRVIDLSAEDWRVFEL